MEYDHDVAIIGGGAAGLTAGIYCGRSGLSSIVLEGKSIGGLTLTSYEIMNYPGYPKISGPDLMARFEEHAKQWCSINEIEPVSSLKMDKGGVTISTNEATYKVGAVIMCMGASHRNLGVQGEKDLSGRGVSYCATCDGFFYKDKKVVQVGGGNTAALEALYLKELGVDVKIVHRRNRLRAEDDYRRRLDEEGVPIMFDTVVKEIKGDGKVGEVVLEDVNTGWLSEEPIDGVFIAIGMIPNNQLAKEIGIDLDVSGYIKVNRNMETNIKRIYAAGDITGGVRQIVTACSEGASAAMNCLKVLGKAYPF